MFVCVCVFLRPKLIIKIFTYGFIRVNFIGFFPFSRYLYLCFLFLFFVFVFVCLNYIIIDDIILSCSLHNQYR